MAHHRAIQAQMHIHIKNKTMLIAYSIIAVCCFLFGCSNIDSKKEEKENADSEYISISVSQYNVPDNIDSGYNTSIFFYDIETSTLEKKGTVPGMSQYPLAVYEKQDNVIYYSMESKDGRDQVYKMDCETGNSEQLTNNLSAINYIIPLEEKLFIVAKIAGSDLLVPTVINKDSQCQTAKESFQLRQDHFIWILDYNPYINKLVFSTMSDKERRTLSDIYQTYIIILPLVLIMTRLLIITYILLTPKVLK